MQITFLGTSHGYSDNGKFLSSALVESGGVSYLIDAGAPVESLLLKYNKNSDDIRGVFITHMHCDHATFLPMVIEPFLRFRFNDKVTCFMPEKKGLNAFFTWMRAMHCNMNKLKETVKFKIVKEGTIYNENGMKVTAKHNLHLSAVGSPSFSYMLECEGKRVLFTGDMSGGFPEYEDIIDNAEYDLVICEMAHSRFPNVWEKLAKTKTKKMIITHTWAAAMGDYEPIFKNMPFAIELAKDGQVIEL